MTRRARRSPPPLWLELAVVAALGLALRVYVLPADDALDVRAAWFAWLIVVGQAIATGLQAVGHAVLVALTWSVEALWYMARELAVGLKWFAVQFLETGKKLWSFTRGLFTNVLRPAWQKFWKFVDWARRTLDDLFRPVFRFLETVRAEFLKYYARFVRPVLDSLDLARKVLRVFSTLGLDWARRLDDELARIQERIDAPFQFVLGKINEVINLVNRVVTANGLFQRLALVRSIERDFVVLGEEYARLRHPLISDDEWNARRKQVQPKTPVAEPGEELARFYRGQPSKYAGLIEELAPDWTRAAGQK